MSEITDNWDLWNKNGGPKYPHEKVIQYTFRNFPSHARKGMSALDLGCGGGVHAVFLASEGFNVSFCDISKIGVSNTIEAFQMRSLKYLSHEVASISGFNFKNGFFDFVVCSGVLDSAGLSEASKCLERVSLALKPGGRGLFIFASNKDFRVCRDANVLGLHGYTQGEVEEIFGKTKWSELNIDRYVTTFENNSYQSNDFLVTVVR